MSDKSLGKWVNVLVDDVPKAHASLPHGALAPGEQNCGGERGGEVYTAFAQDAKMEMLAEKEICKQNPLP